METIDSQDSIVQFADKIGYHLGEMMKRNVLLHYQRTYDFLPGMAMFIASYVVQRTFTRQTSAPKAIKDSICFFFVNMFDDDETPSKRKTQKERAYVHVYPFGHTHESHFIKNTHIKTVSVIISAGYLKSFLKQDAERFQFLFDLDNNFLIEEIMTDDIIRTVNEIAKKDGPDTLRDYYYKMKAIELLFYLFQSLSKRENPVRQKLSDSEIKSVYLVRDKLLSSLDIPTPMTELKQIAGMNELKLRRLFKQVFGMGIYDYFQHFRMKEAARLLREDKLTISETGCQMGFENLSHFSRVFEKYIGKKPKKYSKELE